MSQLPTPVCFIYLLLPYACLKDSDEIPQFDCEMCPPSQGGNTIRQLLKIAKKTVPEDEWKRTPVVLKATAGLRLLPVDKANALLKEVRHVFLSLPSDSLAQTAPVPPESGMRNH